MFGFPNHCPFLATATHTEQDKVEKVEKGHLCITMHHYANVNTCEYM